MPFVISDVSALAPALVEVGAGGVDGGVVGRGRRRQLDEVAGQPQVAGVGDLDGARRQPAGAAGQRRQLGRPAPPRGAGLRFAGSPSHHPP